MNREKLCSWLREHSSGVYRNSAIAADLIEQQTAELREFVWAEDNPIEWQSQQDTIKELESDNDALSEQANAIVRDYAQANRRVKQQEVELNRLELRAEEADCVQMHLDDIGAPKDDGVNTYSLVGRIDAKLEQQAAEIDVYRGAFNALHSHAGVEAFWRKWYEVGEPQKHGTFESTWMSIKEAISCGDTARWAFVDMTLPEYLEALNPAPQEKDDD